MVDFFFVLFVSSSVGCFLRCHLVCCFSSLLKDFLCDSRGYHWLAAGCSLCIYSTVVIESTLYAARVLDKIFNFMILMSALIFYANYMCEDG